MLGLVGLWCWCLGVGDVGYSWFFGWLKMCLLCLVVGVLMMLLLLVMRLGVLVYLCLGLLVVFLEYLVGGGVFLLGEMVL